MKYYCLLFSLLITFASKAQTPDELKSWLPEVDGWKISGEIEVFSPDNLFDRINGSAPLFLENNFREMTSMEYQQEGNSITIQVYRHATPEDAFGMYASERSSDLEFFSIGGEAQGDDQGLYFFTGCIYVKMKSGESSGLAGKTMRIIGKGLAERIDSDSSYPSLLKKFPQEGKIPFSEVYTTSSFIGHEFLKQVYSCSYNLDGKKFILFVVDGQTPEGTRDILSQYFMFTKQSTSFSEGKLTVKDRYNGDIPCLWKGRYVTGLFSESGDDLEKESFMLSFLEDN